LPVRAIILEYFETEEMNVPGNTIYSSLPA
jgi:hypothetical protein